ncbi:MAG: hypothetical protein ABSB13_15750 [Candidatus Binatus sp.]|jgi:hypothetical protein|uniref:hypothetical protein n=1 Tax=Candidatus Binatus sp. TaxID=2811406 RepID=UPI003D0A6725
MTATSKRTKGKSAKSAQYLSGNDLFHHPAAVTLTGKVDKHYDSKFVALPFVRPGKRGGNGHRFWSVKPSGKYQEDFAQGRDWARLAVGFLKYNIGASLIAYIVADMIKAGPAGKYANGEPKVDALAIGFVTELADQIKFYRGEMLRVA